MVLPAFASNLPRTRLVSKPQSTPSRKQRLTRPVLLKQEKCRVRILNAMVAGFFGFIVLGLKFEGFMGKTDV